MNRSSVHVEWGPVGAITLARTCDTLVVVDVLSFSTCVTVAVERGARVLPHAGGDGAAELAARTGALLAGPRSMSEPSLSPTGLLRLAPGASVVLPSPNGATISAALAGADVTVVVGCLRNAGALAGAVAGALRVGVVAAGERWPDGSLRPAYEDWVGAGAVVAALQQLGTGHRPGPEAAAAAAAWRERRPLAECASGRELLDRGFGPDLVLAEEQDAASVVPRLREGGFEA